MSHCLRSLRISKAPTTVRPNHSTSATQTQRSAFLHQFLDADSQSQQQVVESQRVLRHTRRRSVDSIPTNEEIQRMLMPLTNRLLPKPPYDGCTPRRYDPLAVPVSGASDDIILHSGWGTVGTEMSCDHLRNVIVWEKLPVEIVSQSALPARFTAEMSAWHCQCSPLTDYEKRMILSEDSSRLPITLLATAPAPHLQPKSPPANQAQSSEHTPNPSKHNPHLERVFNSLSESLPKFFVQPHDYSIYSMDIVFQNNMRGVTTHGISAYVRQLSMLRIFAHLKYAYVRLEVLKITKHPEDNTVRCRWRIRGITAFKVFLKFWKLKLWEWKDMVNNESDWYDGFSTFYINDKGLVCRHVCDKVMPDENPEPVTINGNLAAKLALLLGVFPKPSANDLLMFVDEFDKLQALASTAIIPSAVPIK